MRTALRTSPTTPLKPFVHTHTLPHHTFCCMLTMASSADDAESRMKKGVTRMVGRALGFRGGKKNADGDAAQRVVSAAPLETKPSTSTDAAAAGAARRVATLARHAIKTATTVEVPSRTLPVLTSCDVLVVGGGPSGLSAALGAARAGADCVLLERFGCFGGVITTVRALRTHPWART